MIQRIQSIFLFLSALCFGLLFKVPFATSNSDLGFPLDDKVYNINDHVLLVVLTGIGLALAFISIFLYKKRSIQLRLGYFVIVVGVLLPALAAWIFLSKSLELSNGGVDDGFGIFLPLLAIVFSFLSNRYIKKDDKLVKSMDRLR
jgi:hypothetical protein